MLFKKTINKNYIYIKKKKKDKIKTKQNKKLEKFH